MLSLLFFSCLNIFLNVSAILQRHLPGWWIWLDTQLWRWNSQSFEILFSSHILDFSRSFDTVSFYLFQSCPKFPRHHGTSCDTGVCSEGILCTGGEIQTNFTPLFFFPTEISRNQSLTPKLSRGTMKERKTRRRCRAVLSLGIHADRSLWCKTSAPADPTPSFAAHFLEGALGGLDSSLFQTEVPGIPE